MLFPRTAKIMYCWSMLALCILLLPAAAGPVWSATATTAGQEVPTIRALISDGRLSSSAVAPLSGLRAKGIDVLGATPQQLDALLKEQGDKLSAVEKQALERVVAAVGTAKQSANPQPARPAPPPLPPMSLPPALPMVELGSAQYAGLITTAKEATLTLMGDLSANETQRFEQRWAAYYDYPSAEISDHFRAATPLLTEFLNIRATIASTSAAFDQVREEAETALEYDSRGEADAALAQADLLKDYLVSLEARGRQLAQALQDLGEAPDPKAAKKEATVRHRSAVEALQELFAEATALEGIWYGSIENAEDGWIEGIKGSPALFVVYSVGDPAAPRYRALALDADEYDEKQDPYIDILSMYDGDVPGKPGLVQAFCENSIDHTCQMQDEEGDTWETTINAQRLVDATQAIEYPPSVALETVEAAYKKMMEAQEAKRTSLEAANKEEDSLDNAITHLGTNVALSFTEKAALSDLNGVRRHYEWTPAFLSVARQWLKERPFSAQTTLAQDRQALSARFAASAGSPPPTPAVAEGAPQKADYADPKTTQDDEVAAQRAGKLDRIEFHKQNIIIIQRNLERDQAELAKETDPERRAQLELRVVGGRTDLQNEKDLIASIESGELVRTRTAFDDYVMAGFIANIKQSQQQMEQFQRSSDALFKLAAMLPGGEGEQARAFVERQLTPEVRLKMDQAAVRRIADALGKKVEGHYLGQQATSDEEAAYATLGLEAAENIKCAADSGMLALSLFGGRYVNAAYQATTGYIEGGPAEAALRTAANFGATAGAAAEAMRGYREGGVEEALKRGAVSLAVSKGMEYGMSKLTSKLGGGNPDAPGTQPTTGSKTAPQTTGRLPKAGDQRALEQFKQARQQGEKLVGEFREAQARLAQAGASGASAEEITILQNFARQKVIAINGNPHAKNFLKYKGDPIAQRAYNAYLRGVHAEVESKFHENMLNRGWNQQPLKEFRNSASAGSVGMDFDIGLDEKAAGALTKNRQPTSVYEWQKDAQEAWNQSYKQCTGHDAQKAWETVTSSAHAESYRDLAWLSADKAGVSKAWAGQSADVTRYKSWHMQNDASLDPMTRLQEISRGAAKDMQTKLNPILDQIKPTGQSAAKFKNARDHWDQVRQVLTDFGENNIDPVTADRRIRALSGGKSIPEVVEEMTYLLEAAVKFGNRA